MFWNKSIHKTAQSYSLPGSVLALVLFDVCNIPFTTFLVSLYVQTALLWTLAFASSARA